MPSNTGKTGQHKSPTLSPEERTSYQNAIDLIAAGNAEKATPLLNRLTQSYPGHFGSWLNLATAYYKQKKLPEAENALSKAKALNNTPETYNLTGLMNTEKGEYTAAEKNYLSAIGLKNNYAEAHYNLALVHDLYYQDLENAIIHYEKYLSIVENNDKSVTKWVAELKQKIKQKASK
jgi:tetratricopeptide (TPR) repeat protein